MSKLLKKVFVLSLCISIMTFTTVNAAKNSIPLHKELTDTLSEQIKEDLKKMDRTEGAKYLKSMMQQYTENYQSSANNNLSYSNSRQSSPKIGDTSHTVSYANSGKTKASNVKGIWINIINGTLSLILGLTTLVGSILYTVASTFASTAAVATDKNAEAENFYSYRYIEYTGLVYNYSLFVGSEWMPYAVSTSREIYEHGWGFFTDEYGIGRQGTVDFPNPKKQQFAPHYGGAAIEQLAYEKYDLGIPYIYYEDWNS